MASTKIFLCRRSYRSSLCFESLPPSVRFSDQKIFYFFLLAYFSANIVHSFAVTNVNFSFLFLCCKPENWNLCFLMKSKNLNIQSSSIHTAILLLVIRIGASIVIDFLPNGAIVHLFTLSRDVLDKVGTHRFWSIVQWDCQHLS